VAALETAESVDTAAQLERTPRGVVKRWVSELEIARGAEKDWRKCGEEVWNLYKSKKQESKSFNILWSNTETLRPALYNSLPQPDVRRRFRDADPVGRYGSIILQRALKYSIDDYDFDKTIQDAVLDLLIPGRGVARVKYEPKFRPIPGVEPDPLGDEPVPEEIDYEQAVCCHVPWDKFLRGPGEKWDEVTWVAFEHRMSKETLVEKFGEELANEIPLSESDPSTEKSKDKTLRSLVKTACVWEIWDKDSRRVLFICEQYPHKPLSETPDPLKLDGFFPTPRPIYAIEDSTSLIPQAHYEKYKIQAEELNKVTRRIDKVVDAMKQRGAYAANLSEVASIIEAGDNQMIPIVNASEVAAMGGLDKAIWIMPIDKLGGVLKELYLAREKTLQTIYEITGLGDIMRGVSNPHETLGAQQLKSQWGTLRLQRFIRDLMRLKAEVIAEHFQEKTLQAMTGMALPSAEEKQQLQLKIQQAQQTQQEVPEDMKIAAQHVLGMPTWQEVMELFRSDEMRRFRIGIETDSTIQETLTRDAQGMQEAVTGIINVFTGLAPAIESGALSVEVAKSICLAMARHAKMGEFVEDAIEKIQQPKPAPPPPPDKSVEVAQVKAQSDQQIATMREQSSVQLNQQKLQHEQQVASMEQQLEQQRAASEARALEMETQHKMMLAQVQEQAKMAIEKMKLEFQLMIEKMKLEAQAEQKELDRQSNERISERQAEVQAQQADADREANMQQAELNAETTKEVAKSKAAAKPAKKE
jgi:hypothetical protein